MLRKLQTKDVIRPEPAPPILAACLSRLPRAGEPGQWRGRFTLGAQDAESGWMNAAQYVVPAVLRGAPCPGRPPGRREPARVTPGAA